MNYQVKPLSAGLYFVATPIGAARDITLRGLDVLASADVIASEDTRTTRKLMEIHGIPLADRRLIAYHDHSDAAAVRGIIALVAAGKSVACVSEAGTPLVADPGFELGKAAIAAGHAVFAAPGPSAVLAALSVGGLPSDRFAFVGFLPSGQKQRRDGMAALRETPFTLVFYESPKRIHKMLSDACDVLGRDRQAAVCRELTKRFEEVQRGTLAELAEHYADKAVKGEIVVLIGTQGAEEIEPTDIDAALREAMKAMRVKDAATAVAGAMGLPRREVYQRALTLGDDD